MSKDESLTDEQNKFLAECEEMFKDRYTEKDLEFMQFKNAKSNDPPIVYPWSDRGRGVKRPRYMDRRETNPYRDRYDHRKHRRYDNDSYGSNY